MRGFYGYLTDLRAMFKCQNCGKCCTPTWAKEIAVTENELANIARYLGRDIVGIKRLAKQRSKHYVLLSPCPFYNKKKKRCSVYLARPLICRMFPSFTFNSKLQELPSFCEGIIKLAEKYPALSG